jgi:hypothetical protein
VGKGGGGVEQRRVRASGAVSARRRNGEGGARPGHAHAYLAAGNRCLAASHGGRCPSGAGAWSGGWSEQALMGGPARFEKFSNFQK